MCDKKRIDKNTLLFSRLLYTGFAIEKCGTPRVCNCLANAVACTGISVDALPRFNEVESYKM